MLSLEAVASNRPEEAQQGAQLTVSQPTEKPYLGHMVR